MGINRIKLANGTQNMKNLQDARMQQTYQQNIADNQAQQAVNQQNLNVGRNRILQQMKKSFPVAETFMNVAAPAINLGRGILGLQDPIGTPSMGDRMKELEATKGSTGSIGYEDYGLPVATPGGRFTGGLPELALSNPVDFALAGSAGRYGFSPEGRTDLEYDFTPDQDTGSTGNAILDFVNEGGVKAKVSDLLTPTTAEAAEPSAMPQGSPGQLNPTMADVAGPTTDASGKTYYDDGSYTIPGFTRLKNPDGAPGNYNEFMYKGPDGQIYGSETYGSISAGQYPDIYDPNKEMMASGGRVGLAEGTDPKLTARQVAEQNPELDAMRQKFFGTNYLADIDKGNTGTVQYYSGLGNPSGLQYTQPVVETPAVDTTTPIVDTGDGGGGGGGGGITGISTGNETGNTDFEYQGTPGGNTGSGEFDLIDNSGKDYGPYTQTMTPMDTKENYGAIGQYEDYSPTTDTIADAPPSLGFGNPPTTLMDDREQYGAIGQYEPGATITAPSGDVYASDDPLAMEKIDFQTPEQTNAIGDAFNSVKDLGAAGVDKFKDSLIALGGKVKEGFDNTIEIGGKTIDLGKSLAGGVLSLVTGLPGIGFALNAIKSDPMQAATKTGLQDKGYQFDDIGRLTDGPMAGYSVESLFGDGIANATLGVIDNIENRTAPQTAASIARVQDLYDFLGDVTAIKAAETAPQEDVGSIPGDMNTGVDPISGDLPGGGNIMDEFATDEFSDENFMVGDTSIAAPATGNTASDSFFDAADNAATSSPSLSQAQSTANIDAARGGNTGSTSGSLSQAQSTANIDAARGGGGGSSGGGKIVCTMMNNSYGFGSFRNKIWLKHSKDMAPEYQIGYHKIFLPLVKLSKTNKVLKKILEHIAIHRTIDIRQEARGKTHLLGRVYRKILEPICYLVGKYAK